MTLQENISRAKCFDDVIKVNNNNSLLIFTCMIIRTITIITKQ